MSQESAEKTPRRSLRSLSELLLNASVLPTLLGGLSRPLVQPLQPENTCPGCCFSFLPWQLAVFPRSPSPHPAILCSGFLSLSTVSPGPDNCPQSGLPGAPRGVDLQDGPAGSSARPFQPRGHGPQAPLPTGLSKQVEWVQTRPDFP